VSPADLEKFFSKRGGEDDDDDLVVTPRGVLEELVRRVESLEKRVSKLEEEIRGLKEGAARGRAFSRAKAPVVEEARHREGKVPSLFRKALEQMNEKGYVSVSRDLGGEDAPGVDSAVRRLLQLGGVKMALGDDMLIVHPTVYREFKSKLETINERDPVACVELFGRAGKLFNELYRRGAIFYDSRRSRWVLI